MGFATYAYGSLYPVEYRNCAILPQYRVLLAQFVYCGFIARRICCTASVERVAALCAVWDHDRNLVYKFPRVYHLFRI